MREMTYGARDFSAETLLRQIGIHNLLAISGGRALIRPTGVTLPVSNGYYVLIDLADNDTYTVQRVYRRRGRQFAHGTTMGAHAEDVGEVAYRASCFRDPFGEEA